MKKQYISPKTILEQASVETSILSISGEHSINPQFSDDIDDPIDVGDDAESIFSD